MIAVSVVLYRTDASVVNELLSSLNRALHYAGFSGKLLLTDHSPAAIGKSQILAWQDRLGDRCEIDYDHVPENPGFGAGHNRAYRRCTEKEEYFLVVNPDIVFERDSLISGVEFLKKHPNIGLIAPALIEPCGNVRPACFREPDFLTLILRMVGLKWYHSKRISSYECRDWSPGTAVFNPPLISGCCMLFRYGFFGRLGGFDTRYFLYFEDFDLSRRARAIGATAFCPDMKVRHFGGGASKKGWRHWLWFIRSGWKYSRSNA